MLENIGRLDKGRRIKLHRAAGRMLTDVDAETMGAFYTACHCKREYEDKAFLATCLLAGQESNGSVKLAEAWKEYIKKVKSDSTEKRMNKLLNASWGPNFTRSLWRIVKMMDRKDIDCEDLAWDIIHWDDDNRRVQMKWQRIIYSNFEKEGDK